MKIIFCYVITSSLLHQLIRNRSYYVMLSSLRHYLIRHRSYYVLRSSLRHYLLRNRSYHVASSSLRHYLLRNSFYYVLDSRQTHDAINSLLSLSFMVFIIASTPLQLKNSFLVVSFFLKSSINLSEICFRTLSLVELESKRPTNGRTRHSSSANISFAFFSFLNF